MITRAIVLIPAATQTADLLRPVAGVPALLRTLLSAQRVGVNEMLLLGHEPFAALQQRVMQDRRLTARLRWVMDQPWSTLVQAVPDLGTVWWEGDLWVLPAGAVIDVTLLHEVARRPINRPIAVIDEWPREATSGGWQVASGEFRVHDTRHVTLDTHLQHAVCRVAGPWARRRLETSGDVALSTALSTLPQRGEVEHVANNGRVCAPVVLEENQPSIERALCAGLQSPSDGWVDRYLNRKLSPCLSRWLLRTPLTPNHVTLIACAIGLAAAFSFTGGGWLGGVVGALLLQCSAVLDCCDGEVARLKFLESPGGYYLDITCDNVVHVAVFAGIAWSLYQTLGHERLLVLGGLAAFGTSMSFLVVLATRHGRARNPSACVDRVLDALTNRDFSILLLLCALAGKLEWFLWALAVGVNLFWPAVLGLACMTQRPTHG